MIPDRVFGSPSSALASAKARRRPRRGAARRLRLPLAVAAVALAVLTGRIVEQRLSARAAIAEGEDAFRRGDFARAADRFRSALEIGSASTAVRLRLIAAYQKQYVPGGDSRANHDVAKQALDEIARVLERDPSNRAAMLAAAEISDGRSDFDQARGWYLRLAAIDSSSAAAFAGMSAASLNEASAAVLAAKARAGVLPAAFAPSASGHPTPTDDLRQALAARWSATIAAGIDAAAKAATIDREHEAAMLTLGGWHELAAELAASSDEYQRHMTSAHEWRRKALDARRLKAERSSP
jgi:tetratricopeptide (TPR) repeat protein